MSHIAKFLPYGELQKIALAGQPEITISEDGYWVINGVKTEVKAEVEVPVQSVNGQTGNVVIEIPDVSGFITKAVNDLTNYYLKSEVNAMISAIPKFNILVVSDLPTTNISTTTVYLVSSGSGSDLYTEYIYVGNKWEILGSQRVDLTGYAKEAWVNTQLSKYVAISNLTEAINTALAQAKASGEFDGEDGIDGVGISSIAKTGTSGKVDTYTITFNDKTTSTFTVTNGKDGVDGVTPTIEISADGYWVINGVKTTTKAAGTNGDDGEDGVGISSITKTGTNGKVDTYTITLTNATTATFTVTNGADGKDGEDGKTPVKYVDYLDPNDINDIVAEVHKTIGTPVFGMVDGSDIVLSGNLADGEYSIKYEKEDKSTVNIGKLVLDTRTRHKVIIDKLENCSITDDSPTEVPDGDPYNATITANDGYELSSVTVTMGGSPVTVPNDVINITSVTGNIVITATATEVQTGPAYTNQIPKSQKADGSLFVGDNGEKGYKTNTRLSFSSGNESAKTGHEVTGFIEMTTNSVKLHIYGVTFDASTDETNQNYICFYDASHTKCAITTLGGLFTVNNGNGTYSTAKNVHDALTGAENSKYFRVCSSHIDANSVITIGEAITL